MKFDDRLPFVPEDLELYFETLGNPGESSEVILERKSIILTKTDLRCIDAVKYHVPTTNDPMMVFILLKKYIRIVMFWGYEQYVIDEFQLFLESDFEENLYSLNGLLGRSLIDILLVHKTAREKFSIEKYLFCNQDLFLFLI